MLQVFDWNDFKGGWFIGDFIPTLYPTENVEVCIKRYKRGDYDSCHMHKLATEITMIVEGTVSMNGEEHHKDDIIVIEKGQATDFLAVTDAITCVVKIPCVKGDKYIVESK